VTAEELEYLLARYGIPSRVQRDEVLVKRCLLCANENYNMELNAAKGVWHCWACDAGGRLDTLLGEQFGYWDAIPVVWDREDKQQPDPRAVLAEVTFVPLSENKTALHYVLGRGVSMAEVIRYRLGVVVDTANSIWFGRVVVPARDYWQGHVVGVIGRALPGMGGPKYLSTLPTRQYTVGIRSGGLWHLIVEGPLDAIGAARTGSNVVLALGKPDHTVFTAWAARVPHNEGIGILLDSDAAKEAESLYWTLKQVHPHVIRYELPEGQDPATYYMGGQHAGTG